MKLFFNLSGQAMAAWSKWADGSADGSAAGQSTARMDTPTSEPPAGNTQEPRGAAHPPRPVAPSQGDEHRNQQVSESLDEAAMTPGPVESGGAPQGVSDAPVTDNVSPASPPAKTEPKPLQPGTTGPPPGHDSDLFELPGAGPGLVWMLENCGINSLQDLATADSDRLKDSLGLVAQILDVDHWISYAVDRTSLQ